MKHQPSFIAKNQTGKLQFRYFILFIIKVIFKFYYFIIGTKYIHVRNVFCESIIFNRKSL